MPKRKLLSRLADITLGPKCKHGNRESCPSCWMGEHREDIDTAIAGIVLVASIIVSVDAGLSPHNKIL